MEDWSWIIYRIIRAVGGGVAVDSGRWTRGQHESVVERASKLETSMNSQDLHLAFRKCSGKLELAAINNSVILLLL